VDAVEAVDDDVRPGRARSMLQSQRLRKFFHPVNRSALMRRCRTRRSRKLVAKRVTPLWKSTNSERNTVNRNRDMRNVLGVRNAATSSQLHPSR
jgi:hypothetical protein